MQQRRVQVRPLEQQQGRQLQGASERGNVHGASERGSAHGSGCDHVLGPCLGLLDAHVWANAHGGGRDHALDNCDQSGPSLDLDLCRALCRAPDHVFL